MADYLIQCEVREIVGGAKSCPGSAKMKVGDVFVIGSKTPEPTGICARVFMSVYPAALAMRFSDGISWEHGQKYFDIKCPDGVVTFRLSRVLNSKPAI